METKIAHGVTIIDCRPHWTPRRKKKRCAAENRQVYHGPGLSLVPRQAYDARAMRRVRGIGGIFFKSENPEALRAWYAKHLGVVSEGEHGTMFTWRWETVRVAWASRS